MAQVEPVVVSSYVQVHGRWLHARRAVGAARADAPVLVLVHGVGMSSRYMMPLAIQLADSFHVYAVDFPGHGRSDKPGHVLQLPELTEVLEGWLQAMQLDRVAMLGNSFGCQMIVEFARRYPQRVGRAVLQGPTVDPRSRSFLRLLLRAAWCAWWERKSLGWVLIRDYAVCGPVRWVKTLRIAIDDRVEDKLPEVKAPVLVVRGAHDATVSQPWAQRVAQLLPDARLVVIPDAAHAIIYSQPRELAEVVAGFLKEC